METNDDFFTPSNNKLGVNNEMAFDTSNSDQKFNVIKVRPKMKNLINQRLLELEGQCKIQKYQFLQFNLVKSIFLMILIVITFFGLFALKYYVWFRMKVFYDRVKIQEATHIYITSNEKAQEIVSIQPLDSKKQIKFEYKKLRYVLEEQRAIPIGFKYEDEISLILNGQFQKTGLSHEEVSKRKQIYGKNQHRVQIQSFLTYLLENLTTPFFLLQYMFCFMYFIQGYVPFSIAILFFSFISTTINYIMLYVSYNKIKEMAQKQLKVKVLRSGNVQEIDSVDLVPGDVFFPRDQIPCDALVLSGDNYVNQANLTGQSYPIGKFPAVNLESTLNSNAWLNEGSKVLQVRQNSKAVVINTGFQTCRGRIIRKILTKQTKQPDLFRSAIIFILEAVIVSIIGFFVCLPLLLTLDIEPAFIFFKLFDFLGSAAPPPLPIFFNVAYSFCLTRLRFKEISGTEPKLTVDAAYTKIFCFDKTGTLTQTQVQVKKIYKVQDKKFYEITDQLEQQKNKMISKLFSCCHTVKNINDEFLGDEIDKQMFFKSKYKMSSSENKQVRFIVEDKKQKLQVLRINQFQSKFQSMSVLVRDVRENRYYIFLKGAPEKIYNKSVNQSEIYPKIVAQLSLSGFRSIGFGYKRVDERDLERVLLEDRQTYEDNIICLGIIGFDNKLKGDAKQLMGKLHLSNIEPKMITGDNILVGVETAVRCGMIKRSEPVILLEGKKQRLFGNQKRTFTGTLMKRKENEQIEEVQVRLKEEENYLSQEYPIAIDGDFFNLEPAPYLPNTIVVFARIKPEDKAHIVTKQKQKIKAKLKETQSKFARFLKINRYKVGMCGDGANDLLALRQADLSLGIQESDASYGSGFTIGKLLDVDLIIRQSKNTQANIIQLTQYYMSAAFFNLLSSIILITDSTYYSSITLMYLNFTSILIFPLAFTFSRPAEEPTEFVPDSNFMGLHNHLMYWGNVVISSCSIIAGYFYFYFTSQFKPNPEPSITIAEGFHSQNHSATIIFLMVLLPFAFNALFIYNSSPWKQKFYRNYFFTFLLVVDITLSILFFFITKDMVDAFQIVEISISKTGICLVIMMGFVLCSFIYNYLVRHWKLDYKVLQMDFETELPHNDRLYPKDEYQQNQEKYKN